MLSTSLCFGVVIVWSVCVLKNEERQKDIFFLLRLNVCFENKLIIDVLLEQPVRQVHRYD